MASRPSASGWRHGSARAVRSLPTWRGSLAAFAAEHGFADQAHLARAVRAMTGAPPCALEGKVRSSRSLPARLERAAWIAASFSPSRSPRSPRPGLARPDDRRAHPVAGAQLRSAGRDRLPRPAFGPRALSHALCRRCRRLRAEPARGGARRYPALVGGSGALRLRPVLAGAGFGRLGRSRRDARRSDRCASRTPEARIRPAYRASSYWSESDWTWLTAQAAPHPRRVGRAARRRLRRLPATSAAPSWSTRCATRRARSPAMT